MRRILSTAVVAASVLVVAGAALAYMGPGRMGMGPGSMMGPGMMGPGAMGGAAAPGMCPGMAAAQTQAPARVTQEEAKALVEAYAQEHLPGFTVEKVLPFGGRGMLAYQVELKGPKGETRTLHVNPWGNVMPFPGSATR
ncbi:MAG: PepSY domain-containing protein [Candidatus Rokubacteria bacterium]|nr:PepSY domain-containing protein [Candidatus Rokubacteria bacterium]